MSENDTLLNLIFCFLFENVENILLKFLYLCNNIV